jgi:hypothetical protein
MRSSRPSTVRPWIIFVVLVTSCARGESLGETTNPSLEEGGAEDTGGMTTDGAGGDEAGSGGDDGSAESGGAAGTGGMSGDGGSIPDAGDDGAGGSVAESDGGDASAGSGGMAGSGGSGGAGGSAGESGTPTSIYVEAESGTGANKAPIVIANDAAASGGKYITKTGGSSNGAPPADGHVTFMFTDLPAGVYNVWGRFSGASTSDDSLWVRMDTGTWTQWNDIFTRVGAAYAWDSVHDSAAANVVVTYPLTAGAHTLEIAYREDGLKMDRFLVTNDLALKPQ